MAHKIALPGYDDPLEGEMLNFDADITFLTAEEGGRGSYLGKNIPLGSGYWTHINLSCGLYGCKVHSLDGNTEFAQGIEHRANMAFYCVKHEHAPEIKKGLRITLQGASHVVGYGTVTRVHS